jgi:isopentenyl-diphosphate delta-isomerase
MPETQTSRRKDAHLDLCATAEVEPAENATLLDHVHLVHVAMPELAVDELDLRTLAFGKTLRAPLLVTGMTGGSERARLVNFGLAQVAEERGVAFGVGSQRAMAEIPELAASFAVREVAPTTVLLGNIGLRQALSLGVDAVRRLMEAIDADGLALHLNPGQELAQPEGDRDFRGGYAMVTALAQVLGPRLLVKETGCGISPAVARRLVDCGVRALDISGLGGTSWVRVEALRSAGVGRAVAEQFAGWGIPTAAAVCGARRAVGPQVTVIASGGLRSGLDAAKTLSLGADLAGTALPVFRAWQERGLDGAREAIDQMVQGLRMAMVLTGSRTPAALRMQPRVITGPLRDWLQALQA